MSDTIKINTHIDFIANSNNPRTAVQMAREIAKATKQNVILKIPIDKSEKNSIQVTIRPISHVDDIAEIIQLKMFQKAMKDNEQNRLRNLEANKKE